MPIDQIPSVAPKNGIGILVGVVGALLLCHYLSLPMLTAQYQKHLPSTNLFADAGTLDAESEWVVMLLAENRG